MRKKILRPLREPKNFFGLDTTRCPGHRPAGTPYYKRTGAQKEPFDKESKSSKKLNNLITCGITLEKIGEKSSKNILTVHDGYGIIFSAIDREGHQEHDHAHDL